MYNTNYECRYHTNDVFLETDNVTEDEKNYIRNILYREDLSNILNIDEESESFELIICELYNKLSGCKELKECMQEVSNSMMLNNEEMGICFLFSYDLLYLTHKCISEYLDKGKISKNNLNLLKNKISNLK
jgi:hypothetical protein